MRHVRQCISADSGMAPIPLSLPSLLGRQVLVPVGPARYFHHAAVVAHPVGDGARGDLVPEHVSPAADAHVGGDDGGPLLIAHADQLEQEVGAAFVDDEELGVRVILQPLFQYPPGWGILQVIHQPRAVHEAHLAPGPDRLNAERDRQMRLSHAGASDEQHVFRGVDEPQGRELLYLRPRHGRLERPVEVGQGLDAGKPRRSYPLRQDALLFRPDLGGRHFGQCRDEFHLALRHHPHVVGQRRRHPIELQRGEVVLGPDVGARLDLHVIPRRPPSPPAASGSPWPPP